MIPLCSRFACRNWRHVSFVLLHTTPAYLWHHREKSQGVKDRGCLQARRLLKTPNCSLGQPTCLKAGKAFTIGKSQENFHFRPRTKLTWVLAAPIDLKFMRVERKKINFLLDFLCQWFFSLQETCKKNTYLARIFQESCKLLHEKCIRLQDSCKK